MDRSVETEGGRLSGAGRQAWQVVTASRLEHKNSPRYKVNNHDLRDQSSIKSTVDMRFNKFRIY